MGKAIKKGIQTVKTFSINRTVTGAFKPLTGPKNKLGAPIPSTPALKSFEANSSLFMQQTREALVNMKARLSRAFCSPRSGAWSGRSRAVGTCRTRPRSRAVPGTRGAPSGTAGARRGGSGEGAGRERGRRDGAREGGKKGGREGALRQRGRPPPPRLPLRRCHGLRLPGVTGWRLGGPAPRAAARGGAGRRARRPQVRLSPRSAPRPRGKAEQGRAGCEEGPGRGSGERDLGCCCRPFPGFPPLVVLFLFPLSPCFGRSRPLAARSPRAAGPLRRAHPHPRSILGQAESYSSISVSQGHLN